MSQAREIVAKVYRYFEGMEMKRKGTYTTSKSALRRTSVATSKLLNDS